MALFKYQIEAIIVALGDVIFYSNSQYSHGDAVAAAIVEFHKLYPNYDIPSDFDFANVIKKLKLRCPNR